MGRYYSGHISGKFWFGIQSSYDASYFGIEHNNIKRYYGCECTCEGGSRKILDSSMLYCNDCYSSYEEHIQDMIDQEIELYDEPKIIEGFTKTWYVSDTEIYYNFEKQHIDLVEENIKELEKIVGKHMSSYKIIDNLVDNDEITYEYDVPENVNKDELILIARLCLGKQILYSLHKHGYCEIYAEAT